jgi:hypothetical protein
MIYSFFTDVLAYSLWFQKVHILKLVKLTVIFFKLYLYKRVKVVSQLFISTLYCLCSTNSKYNTFQGIQSIEKKLCKFSRKR